MTLTQTIDSQFSEFARAYDANAAKVADRTPPPLNVVVRRVGAMNSEAIRQYGHMTATMLDAFGDVVSVAWKGANGLVTATEKALGASADTVRNTSRRAFGDVKQARSTIEHRVQSASGQVGRNLRSVGRDAEKVADRIEREAEHAGDRAVKSADTAAAETAETVADHPTGPYENWTKEELYERAQELDIDGRSGMSKTQLIKALRRS